MSDYDIEYSLIERLVGLPTRRQGSVGISTDADKLGYTHGRITLMWKHYVGPCRVPFQEPNKWTVMCWNFTQGKRLLYPEESNDNCFLKSFDSFSDLLTALHDPKFRDKFDLPPLPEDAT